MITLDLNQRRTKILLVTLAIIFVIVLGFTFYLINKKADVKNQENISPVTTVQPEKLLTSQEIQDTLNKKADESQQIKPLTPQEIQDALTKKAPASSVKPLTDKEIQDALNAKVK